MTRRPTSLILIALLLGCERVGTELTQEILGCAFGEAITVMAGEVEELSDGDPVSVCIDAAGGGDFALVLFLSGPHDEELALNVTVTGGGFGDPSSSFVVPSSRSASPVAPPPDGSVPSRAVPARDAVGWEAKGGGTRPSAGVADGAFEALHRRREAAELGPRLAAWADRSPVGSPAEFQADGMAPPVTVPEVGTMMELNVGASCDVIDRRRGRVSLVTQHAIVVEDENNPTPGFSAADVEAIGSRFDSLVFPTLTGTWGEPPDIDANGRVIVFLTRGVNEKAIFGGVVAGFFWSGDLFPRSESGRLQGCAGSNEAEVIYLGVPDDAGQAGTPREIDDVIRTTVSTAGHELQHLLNAGRRIHVNGASVLEERWLNEGLSFIAEEMLFHAATGTEPGGNLGPDDVLDGALAAPFDEFAENNIGRFNIYLQQTHLSSPLDRDRLTTRGASWAFLRYAADRLGDGDAFFRSLLNAPNAGLENLASALDADPVVWMADWSVAVYADDAGEGIGPGLYDQPSWNYRALIPALRNDGRFPLRLRTIDSGGGLEETLRPAGASSYTVFRLQPGGRALVGIAAQRAPGGRVRAFLVRVR